MGGLLELLMPGSDAANWANQNTNWLGSVGAGLASKGNFADKLSNIAAYQPAGRAADATAQETLNARNQTAAWFHQKGRDDLAQLVTSGQAPQAFAIYQADMSQGGAASPTADIQNYEYGKQNPGFIDYQTQKGGANERSLNSTFLRDANGNIVMGQVNKGGTLDLTQIPEGYSIVDPFSMAQGKAGATAFGTGQGNQQFNLPEAKRNIDLELANIDAIRRDEAGLNELFGTVGIGGVGLPQQMFGAIPGTKKADAQARVNQIVGQNFLQAFASLKGAGAITETEGAKAQDAMARLSSAQTKDGFLAALKDLEAVLKQGYAVMEQKAGSAYQAPGTAAPGVIDMGNGVTIKQTSP